MNKQNKNSILKDPKGETRAQDKLDSKGLVERATDRKRQAAAALALAGSAAAFGAGCSEIVDRVDLDMEGLEHLRNAPTVEEVVQTGDNENLVADRIMTDFEADGITVSFEAAKKIIDELNEGEGGALDDGMLGVGETMTLPVSKPVDVEIGTAVELENGGAQAERE